MMEVTKIDETTGGIRDDGFDVVKTGDPGFAPGEKKTRCYASHPRCTSRTMKPVIDAGLDPTRHLDESNHLQSLIIALQSAEVRRAASLLMRLPRDLRTLTQSNDIKTNWWLPTEQDRLGLMDPGCLEKAKEKVVRAAMSERAATDKARHVKLVSKWEEKIAGGCGLRGVGVGGAALGK